MPDTLQTEAPIQLEQKQNGNFEQRPVIRSTSEGSPTRRTRLKTFDEIKLGMIRGRLANPQSDNNLGEREKAELRKKIDKAESSEKIDGVDFSKCDLALIWKNYLEGAILEIETFSPYLSDHDQRNGSFIGLTKAEEIGLVIGRYLKKIFPKSQTITLYDDYNNTLRDSTEFFGKPTKDGQMLGFSKEAKTNFLINVHRKLQEYGLIRKNEKENQDYKLVSESSKIQEAEKFVGLLEEKGLIKRTGQEIKFANPDSENPLYQTILLRDSQGKWMCEALDATSFLDPANVSKTHLVILPQSFSEQQDKVWEMLRVMNISPKNYHNIFFDESLSPEDVLLKIKQKLEKGKKQLVVEKPV
jgi:hypothetical protein